MQINSVSIVVKYKSIIGIILFNLSKTISFRKYFLTFSWPLNFTSFLWLIFCHPNYSLCPAQPCILYSLLAYLLLNKDIEVHVNENGQSQQTVTKV